MDHERGARKVKMTKVIQVIGRPRTGTNYLLWLLCKNVKNLVVLTYGKHSRPVERILAQIEGGVPEDLHEETMSFLATAHGSSAYALRGSDENSVIATERVGEHAIRATSEALDLIDSAIREKSVLYFLNVKHPASSLLSYDRAWKGVRETQLEQYCHGWGRFYREWIPYSNKIVRFEDLLSFPGDQLKLLADEFGLELSSSHETLTPLHYLNTGALQTSPLFPRREYYITRAYLDEFDADEMRRLKEHCDADVMTRLRYTWNKNE